MSHQEEKDGLVKVIGHLLTKGWVPVEIWDGEEMVKAKEPSEVNSWVEEAAATEEAKIYFQNSGGGRGYIYLVWGNDPHELIADHTLNHDFGLAVEEATDAVFPDV